MFTKKQIRNNDMIEKNERKPLNNYEYLKEYIHLVSLALVFCLLLAVLTYNPTDPSTFSINSEILNNKYLTTNIFGTLGATVSEWFFQLFGIASILFLFIFVIQILHLFKRPREQSRFYLRLFGFPQLIICYLGIISALTKTVHFRGIEILSGGFIGAEVYKISSHFLGLKGSLIALSIGFVSSLTLALGIRPLSSIYWLISNIPIMKIKNFAHTLKELDKDDAQIAPINQAKMKFKIESNNLIEALQDIPKAEIKNQFVQLNHIQLLCQNLEYHNETSQFNNPELDLFRLKQEGQLIQEKLNTFQVTGKTISSQAGPVIHIHEFEPASGMKVNKIFALQDDLALALKAQSLRISLQPGKSSLTIEVPAPSREVVSLRELLETETFQNYNKTLQMVLGKNVDGSPLIADLCQMPHLLVAGSTGSGKSVCINTMLLSLLITKTPRQLRLILIDPKMLELSNYNGIGHLLMPVVTEPSKSSGALKWVIQEMERRYLLLKDAQVRNIIAYNDAQELQKNDKILPYIVVIIDELCDLMMTAAKEVESSIQRLAQKARAAGIHLILATQRPSVDVLTGVIKANLPCRLSFQVASRHDSRTIIENIGAERLLGKGDMLFLSPGNSKITRAQCAFVNDKEINSVSDKLRSLYPALYENDIMKDIERVSN